MSRYFITLTPLDWFFFGGEKTLGGGQKADYFARSNKFPQQTAILGMLRYQLLKQKGWLKNSDGNSTATTAELETLIGCGSFSMDNKEASFGKIKKISPTALFNDELYIPIPLDNGLNLSFVEANVSWNDSKKVIACDRFDHKNYRNYDMWISKQFEKESAKIFESKMQIGITKYGGDDAFYKQEVLRLKDGFKFAFYAEIDEELKPDYVFLGAQQSCFKMDVNVSVENAGIEEIFKQKCSSVSNDIKGIKRIVLLSNTYVEDLQALKNLCVFHWSNSECFRNMEECADGNLHSGAVRYKKQEVLYNFIKAGSVLYFDEKNETKIKQLLDLNYLQSIGYNYYV